MAAHEALPGWWSRPQPGSGHVAVDSADAAQLHSARYALNKGRVVPVAQYSRDALIDCGRQPASPTTNVLGAHCNFFAAQKQVDEVPRRISRC